MTATASVNPAPTIGRAAAGRCITADGGRKFAEPGDRTHRYARLVSADQRRCTISTMTPSGPRMNARRVPAE